MYNQINKDFKQSIAFKVTALCIECINWLPSLLELRWVNTEFLFLNNCTIIYTHTKTMMVLLSDIDFQEDHLTTTHFLQWSNLKFTLCAETSVQKYTLRITEYYMGINTTWQFWWKLKVHLFLYNLCSCEHCWICTSYLDRGVMVHILGSRLQPTDSHRQYVAIRCKQYKKRSGLANQNSTRILHQ